MFWLVVRMNDINVFDDIIDFIEDIFELIIINENKLQQGFFFIVLFLYMWLFHYEKIIDPLLVNFYNLWF
jgi:hypothetical protein